MKFQVIKTRFVELIPLCLDILWILWCNFSYNIEPNSVFGTFQETHEPFDIHQYGTKILDGVATNVNKEKIKATTDPKTIKIPFRRVVEGKSAFQVCRYFLATLQLVRVFLCDI